LGGFKKAKQMVTIIVLISRGEHSVTVQEKKKQYLANGIIGTLQFICFVPSKVNTLVFDR